MNGKRLKKWFMLQVWRLQQVAQILTLAMLAITLSLQIYSYLRWRAGPFFETPYIGVPILLLILALIIWGIAIYWDLRLKMWREQVAVLVEKNPYMKERFAPKEAAVYALTWLPIMEHLGKQDPTLKAHADSLREWLQKEFGEDDLAQKELGDILEYLGKDRKGLFGLGKPPT